ncbi:GNAT family N-acetyltransferase [Saccharospirillum salsuginis]|uniref:N-acetyltransferase domain-containing protein n=1 Tax=Saccharospirillum salsuginis TaxID=418750 RepID=A0A918K099_9GAMM|nr:GNAT family N-acetyltransferase [Saccharospirillum salsuginis]GGX38689.1 hypothetical protein GCM10007392_01120 [Saccharospirillum salsuginis]
MKERLSIQPIAPEELELVAEMNRQLQSDEGSRVMALDDAIRRLSKWLANEYSCHVYRVNGQIAGYVLYRSTDPDTEDHSDAVYIRHFYIVPEFRGHGLGKAAFALLTEEVLPSETCITLEALVANPSGRAFWKALGFQEYSIRYERKPDSKNAPQ